MAFATFVTSTFTFTQPMRQIRNHSKGSSFPVLFFTFTNEDCDLYHVQWVYDQNGPLYSNNSCPVLTHMQNCQGNGRPDKEYENWRWKPERCNLPRFDPKKLMNVISDII
ncbi:hypothetical protein POM88_044178 [Heracleum sosnowskyi]|uniref:Trichome birefringence-like N-terminal domain-containing protein n=1 Tax=Heracleum sosnowskyi TaxID=360622 RepID=A0AAD8M4W8_9APIA|nr:hypothetical protein POM88_044178 [Heracleum sosnowskyi]